MEIPKKGIHYWIFDMRRKLQAQNNSGGIPNFKNITGAVNKLNWSILFTCRAANMTISSSVQSISSEISAHRACSYIWFMRTESYWKNREVRHDNQNMNVIAKYFK